MLVEAKFKDHKNLLSVVVPCYNEEEVLDETIPRLTTALEAIPDIDFEIVFVDDGSADGTLERLRCAAEEDDRILVVSFARNFGHQIAVTAGTDVAIGDAVAVIDADLQDPPELIADMLEKWREGYEVVYGKRTSREGESAFKLASAGAFYRILNRFSEVPIPLDTGDFRLMDRAVVDCLKAMPERHRFIRGMVAWVGYRQCALPYERAERFAGTSKYPLRKMVAFATDGILSFSSKPLRFATWLGIASASLALLGIFYALVMRLFTSIWIEGWTALMIAVLFLGGIQLLSLGIIGEYIARIHSESKHRPLYLVKSQFGARTPRASRHPSAEKISLGSTASKEHVGLGR